MTLDPESTAKNIETFLARTAGLSKETLNSYRRQLRELERWIAEERTVTPSEESFERYKKFLLARHARSSVSTYLVAARRFALFLGVTVNVKGEERAPRQSEMIDEPERNKLWKNVDLVTDEGLMDAAMIALATAGLGVARIAALDCSIFTLGEGESLIVTSGERQIALGRRESSILSHYLARRNPEKLSEPLFVLFSKKYRRLMRVSAPTVRKRINWWLERAGIRTGGKRISPRSFIRR